MESTENNPNLQFSASTPDNLHPAACTLILKSITTAIYICDTGGRIAFYNSAMAELWGGVPETAINIWYGPAKVFNPDGSRLMPEDSPILRVLHGYDAIKDKEFIIERPDGTRKHIFLNAYPLPDENGTIAGIANIITDTTDRTQEYNLLDENDNNYKSLSELLEKKVTDRTFNLKKNEERYHKMIEEVQDYAILLLDKDGCILNWNLGAEKIKGYTEKEIIGKNFRIFYQNHDKESLLPEKLIQEAHDTGRARHEGWRVRKDGSKFWGSVVITALHDNENNIIGFSKVTRDLTEKKLADDRMQNYAREIEFRNKQLEEYAYIASHDLQEPLRKIQIFAEMLESNIKNEEVAKKHLAKINSAAKRMSNLIKDVLKYSQLSHADELFAEIDLNDVLATIKEDFDLLIEQKNVVLKQSALPVIKGIPIQLHQLFANLISNAIKFSSENPVVEIFSENADIDEISTYPGLNVSRRYSKVIVRDNGVGFDQKYGEQVFKMFKRLTDNSGTGIGLALCKKVVENHGGNISVVSDLGKGTEFTIFLPVE